jgi:hypothetical protein
MLSSIPLSMLGAPKREPVRPKAQRGADFDEKFDAETFAFDCFRMPDGKVALLGPSLFNLSPLVAQMRVEALPSGADAGFVVTELERHVRIIVDAPEGTQALRLHLPTGKADVEVQDGESDLFAGRRVLLTISQNNHFDWIRDWVAFARDHHGADALLLYDNGSTHYSTAELRDALSDIEGMQAIRVVDWPFKFGPQGILGGLWDSDFCQLGAWEHARWRYLAKARSVQNADIDELLLSKRGRSVFEATESSLFGVLSYRGRWVMGTDRTQIPLGSEERRHQDYDTVLRVEQGRRFGFLPIDKAACPTKWTLVPAKCPTKGQWGMHSVYGWPASRLISRDFSYRHFREISNSWKYARNDRPKFDPALHEHDELLAAYRLRASD